MKMLQGPVLDLIASKQKWKITPQLQVRVKTMRGCAEKELKDCVK